MNICVLEGVGFVFGYFELIVWLAQLQVVVEFVVFTLQERLSSVSFVLVKKDGLGIIEVGFAFEFEWTFQIIRDCHFIRYKLLGIGTERQLLFDLFLWNNLFGLLNSSFVFLFSFRFWFTYLFLNRFVQSTLKHFLAFHTFDTLSLQLGRYSSKLSFDFIFWTQFSIIILYPDFFLRDFGWTPFKPCFIVSTFSEFNLWF